MKKIINQKRYDTDTAKKLGTREYSHPGDFNWTSETLYQKRTGEFFLHGEGGAASKYAEAVGQNSWSGGERIMPLSFEDARKWAEENLEADEYEAIFGEVSEDGAKKTIGLSLPESVVEKLRTEAGKSGQTMSDIVAGLVEKM